MFTQWKKFIFWNVITKKEQSSKFYRKGYHGAVLFLFTATPPVITIATHNGKHIYPPSSSNRKGFTKKYIHCLVILTRKLVMLERNGGHWKLKTIVHFGHMQNVVKYFQKYGSLKSSLHKWIIYHHRVIQSPIKND